jgi:hypothetical protein
MKLHLQLQSTRIIAIMRAVMRRVSIVGDMSGLSSSETSAGRRGSVVSRVRKNSEVAEDQPLSPSLKPSHRSRQSISALPALTSEVHSTSIVRLRLILPQMTASMSADAAVLQVVLLQLSSGVVTTEQWCCYN